MRALLNFELKVPVEVYKGSTAFIARCPIFDVSSQGKTPVEAKKNLEESRRGLLAPPLASPFSPFIKGGWGDLKATSCETSGPGFWPRLFHCPSVLAARTPAFAPTPSFLTARIFTTIRNLSFY
jgi:hypothetical protein